MTVILYGKYVSFIGGEIFQRNFAECSITKMNDGVKLAWAVNDYVEIYFDSITTNINGSEKSYTTVDEMYTDYTSKQQSLSSGGGGNTGWNDMLNQDQLQATDQNINLNYNGLYFNNGDVFFTDNDGNINAWFSGNNKTSQIGNSTYLLQDENAGIINVNTANGFGNLTDGTWQINNDGSVQFGKNSTYPIEGLLGVYDNSGYSYIGDNNGDNHYTYIGVDDNFQTQTFNANNGFTFSGGNIQVDNTIGNLNGGTWLINNDGSAFFNSGFFEVNPINTSIVAESPTPAWLHIYNNISAMGDLGQLGNKTTFTIDDNDRTQTFNANNGFTFTGNLFEVKTSNYPDNLFHIDNDGIVGIGDYVGDVHSTSITINDLDQFMQLNAGNGFLFTGGSTISSDGDLSLLGGDAGIFSDGSILGWDNSSPLNNKHTLYLDNTGRFYTRNSETGNQTLRTLGNGDFSIFDNVTNNSTLNLGTNGDFIISNVNGNYNTLYTDGNGLFFIGVAETGNQSTLYTDGNGQFYIADKTTGDQTLYTSGFGDFSLVSKATNYTTMNLSSGGSFHISDDMTGNETFIINQDGLQSVDAIHGFGNMSPYYKFGSFTPGARTKTTLGYITISIDGIETQIEAYQ